MARKIPVKTIVQLKDAGLSRHQISETRHISRNSVSDVFELAEKLGIHYTDIKDLDEAEVYKRFFPDKDADKQMFSPPDYEYIHKELGKQCVTMALLYQEYRAQCLKDGTLAVGRTKFYEGYGEFTRTKELTNHMEHKPGDDTQVDWAGKTMYYVDPLTREKVTVYFFVSVLPFSMYAYMEPCKDMKMSSFIYAQVHMFNYYGGVTRKIICDNLKTGVVEHPKDGEIVLTATYEAFGEYYMSAIVPAGVRRPKQKSGVEGSVKTTANAFIAAKRNVEYHSLEEIKKDVTEFLEVFNREPFKKREGSRYEVFMSEEKETLRDLPPTPFEITRWVKGRVVQKNYHVAFEKNYYSCPYQYYGKKVDLLVSDTTLTIYYEQKRLAVHKLFPPYAKNRYSTHDVDVPPEFLKAAPWSEERYRNWAREIGPYTSIVIDRIFKSVKIPEQGFNSCHAVLGISRKYSPARLESACGLALSRGIKSPRYRQLNSLISSNQDLLFEEQKKPAAGSQTRGGFLRGSSYYQNQAPDTDPPVSKEEVTNDGNA